MHFLFLMSYLSHTYIHLFTSTHSFTHFHFLFLFVTCKLHFFFFYLTEIICFVPFFWKKTWVFKVFSPAMPDEIWRHSTHTGLKSIKAASPNCPPQVLWICRQRMLTWWKMLERFPSWTTSTLPPESFFLRYSGAGKTANWCWKWWNKI